MTKGGTLATRLNIHISKTQQHMHRENSSDVDREFGGGKLRSVCVEGQREGPRLLDVSYIYMLDSAECSPLTCIVLYERRRCNKIQQENHLLCIT